MKELNIINTIFYNQCEVVLIFFCIKYFIIFIIILLIIKELTKELNFNVILKINTIGMMFDLIDKTLIGKNAILRNI